MNKANTNKLNQNFPGIFPKPFHFECGDSWFDLLHRLCSDITQECEKLGLKDTEWTEAVQVKEKFGGLRFYVYSATDSVCKLIESAEERSLGICEDCGLPGKLRSTSWMRVTCDFCEALLLKGKRNGNNGDEN